MSRVPVAVFDVVVSVVKKLFHDAVATEEYVPSTVTVTANDTVIEAPPFNVPSDAHCTLLPLTTPPFVIEPDVTVAPEESLRRG